MKQNIVLIGMPGCGKSTIGRHLARKMSWRFIETDAMVVEDEGCSIPELFERKGEGYFRDAEARSAQQAAAMDKTVISTGGGMILRPENMKTLAATGTVLFLDRPPEAIAKQRLEGRPLLAGGGDRVFTLYQQRIALYRGYAHHIVRSEDCVEQVMEQILQAVRKDGMI